MFGFADVVVCVVRVLSGIDYFHLLRKCNLAGSIKCFKCRGRHLLLLLLLGWGVTYVRDRGILGGMFKLFIAGLSDPVCLVLFLEFPDVH